MQGGGVGGVGDRPEGSGLERVNHGTDAIDIGSLVQLLVGNGKEYEEWWGGRGQVGVGYDGELGSLLPHDVDVPSRHQAAGRRQLPKQAPVNCPFTANETAVSQLTVIRHLSST